METKIVIIDCEKAGLIGGPFAVWVVRDEKIVATTSGCASQERAQRVKAELERIYVREVA